MLHMRLHDKFLFLVIGSLVIFLGILSYALVQREAGLLEREADEKQHVLAFTIYSDLKLNMMRGAPRSTLELMDSLRGSYGLLRLAVVQPDGSPAFGSAGSRLQLPALDQSVSTGKPVSLRENADKPIHTILYPFQNAKDCQSCHLRQGPILGVLVMSISLEDTIKEIETSSRRYAFSLLALILLIGGMLYVLINKVVLQPLAVLHRGAERIGRGELGHRVDIATNDEVQELADSLNVMAARLEESYAELERKVRERTSQLSTTIAVVGDKAASLYQYSRDMATISRLSTKVFNAEQPFDDLLDRFLWAVTHGLGYRRSLLCLIDRRQSWLAVKRDSGLGAVLSVESQPLHAANAFAGLVRSGKELLVQDPARDPVLAGYLKNTGMPAPSLMLVPIRTGIHGRRCWEMKNCIRKDCPAYGRTDESCWLLPHTLCGNSLMETYGDKLAYCMTCEVFPVLGVLIVAARSSRPFRRRDINVLRILATEMGAALENHYLHADNRQLVRELLELHNVTAAALADLSLDSALEAFTDSAMKFSGLDACNFWLLSDDGRELVHRAGSGPDLLQDGAYPRRVPLDRGVLWRAFTGNRLIAEYNLPANDAAELADSPAGRQLPGLLALPLQAENRAIGVLSVHKKGTAPFLESEVAAFMLLANHAAMAINVCILNQELKSQNRELARSTSLMTGILSSLSSGVMLIAPDGRVQLLNQAGAGILQVRQQDLMHQRLVDFVPDAGAFLETQAGPYGEAGIRRRDGSTVPVGFSTARYDDPSGRREATIVLYRDLTEIKELEAAVLQKERFAAMGRVVAGVAHEIRNPLFGISSIGQIFERELRDPAHRKLAGALLSETKRLNHLVEDLLIYGRPIKLSPAPCDLMALWEEVIGIHREELSRKSITLARDIAIAHLRAVLDANQIRQVFLNLLGNALDATPESGTITIRLLLEDRHLIFKIADTGEGIPPGNIDRVFDLFFTTKAKGTGLGLAICKKIVEDHGGTISIESGNRDGNEGRGATVTVRLPYRAPGDQREKGNHGA